MIPDCFCSLLILACGYIVPAFASFKAIKNKNSLEYVRLMKYWVVLALYEVVTTFTDIFLFWLPFYTLGKALFVLWMSLPVTQGSTILFHSYIFPELQKQEELIEKTFESAKQNCYSTIVKYLELSCQQALRFFVANFHLLQDKFKNIPQAIAQAQLQSFDNNNSLPPINTAQNTSLELIEEENIQNDFSIPLLNLTPPLLPVLEESLPVSIAPEDDNVTNEADDFVMLGDVADYPPLRSESESEVIETSRTPNKKRKTNGQPLRRSERVAKKH